MKRDKRFLALILIVIMAIGLVGCKGKKEETKETVTLASTMEKMQDFKTGEFEYTMTFKGTGTDMEVIPAVDVKFTGVVTTADPIAASIDISYKLDGDTEYISLTDMVINDADIYINIKTLKEALAGFGDATVSMYSAFIPDGKDYLSITQEEIQSLSEMSGTEVSTASYTDTESYILASIHFSKFFENAVKDVEPKLITVEEGKVSVVLNNDNITPAIDAILKGDMGAAIDAFVTEGEKLKGDKTIVTEVKDNKESLITQVTEALTEAKTQLQDSDVKLDIKMNIENEGEKGSRVATTDVTANVSQTDNTVDITFKGSQNEKISGDKKVTIPESVITFTELYSSLLGGQ